MGSRVPEDMESLWALIGDDGDGGTVGDRGVQVHERAVDVTGQGGLRQARTDRFGHGEHCRALGNLLGAAVGEFHADVGHGFVLLGLL